MDGEPGDFTMSEGHGHPLVCYYGNVCNEGIDVFTIKVIFVNICIVHLNWGKCVINFCFQCFYLKH